MPIYEYRCQECGKVSSFLLLPLKAPFTPKCKRCRSSKMTRILSRIAKIRSEESRLESLTDPSKIQGVDENDPASMARWMKRMGKELGEDMGEDFDSMIDGAMDENGADPEGWAQAESKEDL